MNKIYLFLCLLLSALLTACYEDKGNYDYHPVNEIQISNIGKEYIRERWQHLSIEPQLKFSLDEKAKMAWRWEIDGKLISEDLNLSYDVAQDVRMILINVVLQPFIWPIVRGFIRNSI
ncbi:MAG: PKD-like family lipoprotein [Odoribacter splanchnicus]